MADPVLNPLTTPVDLALPTNTQQMINMVAAYVQIAGLTGLQGIIISATEPASTDRDKAWLKLDVSTGRCIGLYRYSGGWILVPVICGVGTSEPGNAKPGELFVNTMGNALKAFLGGVWTTELWHKDTTANRPASAALGYLFYDTDIQRLLRLAAQGWTTVDGGIGELRMFTGISVDVAETQNPGWVTEAGMAGKFPLGQDGDVGDYPVGKEAGSATLNATVTTSSAAGGSREQGLVSGITLQGTTVSGAANTNKSTDVEIDTLPPYRSVIFMRKAY